MRTERPNPDQLLKLVQAEKDEHRARLKVFLGASAGVGKTYAMLSDAHEQLARGVDVVIGYVECHGRAETEALVAGIESLPMQVQEYRGVALREFDLDGALRRAPQIVIVDELAHTNVPGSRHPKRWQDIDELLAAGISVYTALNIQHVESLSDVVAKITGVVIRETVPDAVLERADSVELIDIPPEELRQRLREGKVYVSEQIDAALDGFFKHQNLLALRELALRRAADRVEADTISYREGSGEVWATRERVLVCVAPNRLGELVVRSAARLGTAIHGEMFALFVESDRQASRSAEDRERVEESLRMAERLGMETSRRVAHDIVAEIINFAQARNITLIVVGKPIKPRWRELLFGSVVDELVRRSGEINVHVITTDERSPRARRVSESVAAPHPQEYIWAAMAPVAASLASAVYRHFLHYENIVALYVLAVAFASTRISMIPAVVSCVLSVLAYDFFVVPPTFSFDWNDARYIPSFFVLFFVSLLVSSLTQRMRSQAESANARERRTAALYELSRELSRTMGFNAIAGVTAHKIQSELNVDAAVFLPTGKSQVEAVARSRCHFEKDLHERSVAQWVFDHGQSAGAGTDTLRGAVATYFPVATDRGVLAVLGAKSMFHNESISEAQHPELKTFANSMALALERAMLARESHEARLTAETEKLRSSLLSSVSHDIRTPLTIIQGAASAIVEGRGPNHEFASTILEQVDRLNRNVRNLLDMTRLETGSVDPKLEWHDPEELVGVAIRQASPTFAARQILSSVPPDLPLIKVDAMLLEQALVNLLENASRHTPAGTPIEVSVSVKDGRAEFLVSDRGDGVSQEARPHLFEKFNQMHPDREGFGLGLAIASAAVQAQGGTIELRDRIGGGSTFALILPAKEAPPAVPVG